MVPRLRVPRSSSNACACIRLQNGDEESSGKRNEEDRVKINGKVARSENEEEGENGEESKRRRGKEEGNTVVRKNERTRGRIFVEEKDTIHIMYYHIHISLKNI